MAEIKSQHLTWVGPKGGLLDCDFFEEKFDWNSIEGHFHWFLGQKASKIGTQPPYIPNLNFVSMSIPATIPIKFLESVCHKLYSEIEITRTPRFVEIPRSPRYISNKRLENRLYTSSTTTRKKLLPNIGKVVENKGF